MPLRKAPRRHPFPTVEAAAADPLVAMTLGLNSELYGKVRTVPRYIGLQAAPSAADPWERVVAICNYRDCAARGGHRLDFDKLMDSTIHCVQCGAVRVATTSTRATLVLPASEPERDSAGNVLGWRCKKTVDCAARTAAAAHKVLQPAAASQRAEPEAHAPQSASPPPRPRVPAAEPTGEAALERDAAHVEKKEVPLWPFAARLGCGPPVAAPPEEWFLPPPQ